MINPAASLFSSERMFSFGGKEFKWQSDRQLIELGTEKVIASFERRMWAIKKKGVLTVSNDGMHMLDVVILSAITMQYKEQELRRRNWGLVGGLAEKRV